MKVIAFNGSPRKNANTLVAINTVFEQLHSENIETKIIDLYKYKIQGCIGCMGCARNQNKACVLQDDFNSIFSEMIEADGVIVGSPVYVSNMTGVTKCFIERAGLVAKVNNNLLDRKVGASVVAVRRGGACPTFSAINYFFLICGMMVPGSSYWNFGMGLQPGEIVNDAEGMETFKKLGKNMAWLLKKIHS